MVEAFQDAPSIKELRLTRSGQADLSTAPKLSTHTIPHYTPHPWQRAGEGIRRGFPMGARGFYGVAHMSSLPPLGNTIGPLLVLAPFHGFEEARPWISQRSTRDNSGAGGSRQPPTRRVRESWRPWPRIETRSTARLASWQACPSLRIQSSVWGIVDTFTTSRTSARVSPINVLRTVA